MRKLIPILLVLLLIGCKTQELPESWSPLTTIIERPLEGVGGDYTTVSPYLFIDNMDKFNNETALDLEALRRHEVTHAEDQEAYIGLVTTEAQRNIRMSKWVGKYLMNKAFRWEVEQRGYKAAMLYRMSMGQRLIPEGYASIFSSKVYGDMVSYEEALEWAKKVIQERH